jgi:phospholipase C
LRVDEGVETGPNGAGRIQLTFVNEGTAGAVFHVYDRRRLDLPPRRFTVEAGRNLADAWDAGAYDLWVLGPGGFHRHFVGQAPGEEPTVASRQAGRDLILTLGNLAPSIRKLTILAGAYGHQPSARPIVLAAGAQVRRTWPAHAVGGWYDLTVRSADGPGYLRRLAGRVETGAPSITDPAMAGPAIMDQLAV